MIHRVHKTRDYSVISNVHLRDKELTLKTKGLLSLMLSLPDDWNYSRDGLILMVKEGRAVIDACLKELEEHGYLIRTQARDSKGHLAEAVYDIYETPQAKKPLAENPPTDKPPTGKPPAVNQPQLNTNILNTNITNIDIDIDKVTKKQNTDSFDEFWSSYPKKVGKKDAMRAFKKVKVDIDVLLIALEKQKQSEQWTKDNGQYIPNASTWLNGERWNDSLTPQQTTLSETMKNLNNFLERNK